MNALELQGKPRDEAAAIGDLFADIAPISANDPASKIGVDGTHCQRTDEFRSVMDKDGEGGETAVSRARGRPCVTGKIRSTWCFGDEHLVWRIRDQMQRSGVPTVLELHRRLKELDPGCVTYTQLAAFVSSIPERITARTLHGICVVLSCRVDDLLGRDRQIA
jgi:DNA-binding Xre family transcriptional regulator